MRSDLLNLPTEVVVDCVNCKRNDSVRDSAFESWLALCPPYGVRKCKGCGLRWLSPRPSSAGYESVYSAENYFEAEAGEDIAYRNMIKTRCLHFKDRLLRLTESFPQKKSLNILDYGAATGEFAAIAVELGHSCVGIEFSQDARKIAMDKHGIALYAPEAFPDSSAYFDVIHMNHVFEHMANPAEQLAWCASKLADGGFLVIEVPQQFVNHIDRLKRLLGRGGKLDAFGAFSLHHTYFFSMNNLKELILNAGFEVLQISTAVQGSRLGQAPTLKSKAMRIATWLSDFFFCGGDNIEVIARRLKHDEH